MELCKICGNITNPIFSKKVMFKYSVTYHLCRQCGFLQTDEPFWLEEAYSSAITNLDIGLVWRNEQLASIVSTLLKTQFDPLGRFVDYGGGYGLFVRMMRDRGFDYYRQDKFCENLFAKDFDYTLLPPENRKFDLLSAFEVLEHLSDPIKELDKMLGYADNLVFSTEVLPTDNRFIENWWYIAEETGQHIAFYSHRSLQLLASRYGLHLLSYRNIHIFSKEKKALSLFRLCFNKYYRTLIARTRKLPSRLSTDFEQIRKGQQQRMII